MKNKVMMLNLVALLFASATFAQGVENDDMYFNSKDRAKLKAQQSNEQAAYSASVKKANKTKVSEEEFVNPTDSYSARNVNPEFAARSNSQTAQADNQDYFVNNFKYNTSNNLSSWNNNYNNWYSNAWYSPSYFGPSTNSWNSPYYYDSWGNPMYSPYYRNGWSSSFSYYGGSGWGGMGYGMSYGMGYGMGYYGNPYMNSWGSSYGYGSGYGYYGGGYPGTVVIINNNNHGEPGRNVVYGRRASHGGAVITPQGGTNNRTRTNNVATPTYERPNSGGRVATQGTSQRQEEYYNRSWRNSQQSEPGYAAPSRSSSNNGWSNSNSDSFNRNSGSNSNSSFSSPSPSRSSSIDSGGGGGTRSSAPASSGSNGRTRGRD